jgi:hypothetical protein
MKPSNRPRCSRENEEEDDDKEDIDEKDPGAQR